MRIRLYLNSAENNRLDKSAYLQEVMTLDGNLREPSSIITPTITFNFPSILPTPLIDEDDEEVDTIDGDIVIDSPSILKFNYIYIEDFARYYYVSDIVIQRTGLYVVSLVVDPLMSFKDNLLNLPAFIERNEFDYNELADDGLMGFEMGEDIENIYPQSIAPEGELFDFSANRSSGYSYVLNVINDLNKYSVDILPPEGTSLPRIGEDFSSPTSYAYALGRLSLEQLADALIADDTLNSYIKSIIAFPFDVPNIESGSRHEGIRLGSTTIATTNTNPNLNNSSLSSYIEIARFTMPTISDFKGFKPYSTIEVYLPFYGYQEIDMKILSGHDVSIYYSINYEDGSAQIYVHDLTADKPYFTTECQLGVKLSFDTTNNRENVAQRNASILNSIIGVIGGGASAIVGGIMSNPLAVIGGSIGVASSFASLINKNALIFDKGNAGILSGAGALYIPLQVFIRIRRKPTLVNDMNEYRHQFGSPLGDTRLLSELSGFTLVSSIHLENLSAFKSEKDEIERLLKSGIIL